MIGQLIHNLKTAFYKVYPGLVPVVRDVRPKVRRHYRAVRWMRPGKEFSIADINKWTSEELKQKYKFFAQQISEVHNHQNYYKALSLMLTEKGRAQRGKLPEGYASRFRNLKENWAKTQAWESQLIDKYNAIAGKLGEKGMDPVSRRPTQHSVSIPVERYSPSASDITKRTLSVLPEEHSQNIKLVSNFSSQNPLVAAGKIDLDNGGMAWDKESGSLFIYTGENQIDAFTLLHAVGQSLYSDEIDAKIDRFFNEATARETKAAEERKIIQVKKPGMGSVSSAVSHYALTNKKKFFAENYRAFVTMPRDTFKSLAPRGMYEWMRNEVFGGVDGFSYRKSLGKAGVAVI